MSKYMIEVQWHYKAFDAANIEVEADSLEEAQEKALASAPNHTSWRDGEIVEGEYYVNEDCCYQLL